jgi:hypothetical protein
MNSLDIRQRRDPRAKKLKDSKRIRVKNRYHKSLGRHGRVSLPLVEYLEEDESGFPVYVQSHDYSHTFTVKAVRRYWSHNKLHTNGRNEGSWKGKTPMRKSSRDAMRNKNQWREEAHEALKEQQ